MTLQIATTIITCDMLIVVRIKTVTASNEERHEIF